MYRRSTFIFLFALTLNASAASLPLTTAEVGLMLRSGYSNANVMRELSNRHFVDTVDSTQEQRLVKEGASPELIAALKEGNYSLSTAQSTAAKQQIVDLTNRSAS